MENGASTRVRLGKFELDLATGELCGGGETVQLGEKSFRVLFALTENGGQLVTREALQEKLWPNDTIVDFEHGINTAIKLLRRALGDSADSPKYIETIPRRGYRLIVPVEPVVAPDGKVGALRDAGVEVRAMSLPGVLSGTAVSHFRLNDVIGSGGMGVVYRAEDLKLQRSVAVKFLQEELGSSPQALERFRREARAISLLDHPNICPIYEYGEHNGQPFIVMPLLKGETLREKLREGALPIRAAINLGVQVARGLAAAHDKGIVHRDLKPENLFVCGDGPIKIFDFGLAKLIEHPSAGQSPLHESETTLTAAEPHLGFGTASYMSPEQIRGKAADHRSDLFAFGAVFYEMLTGRRAFQKPTAPETMTAILNEDPPAVSQSVPDVPRAVERVIHRCLQKAPEERFQSAVDLAFALEAISDPGNFESPAAAPSDNGAPVQHRARRTAAWSIGLVAVISLAAVVYFAIERWNRFAPPRIAGYTQITRDGHAGEVIGTDGTRLYLERGIDHPIEQVAVSGGEIESVPSIALQKPYLNDVSPDGSTLLVQSYEAGISALPPLYSVRIPGGAHRYLTNSISAIWSPDGKFVLFTTRDGDLYVMGSDGSNVHKVAHSEYPSAWLSWSPNGKIIRFAERESLWEMSSNGANLHALLRGWRPSDWKVCGSWSSNGDYFFFRAGPESQIWALDDRRGLFRKPFELPIQMTSGPIHWGNPVPSKDGTKIFATGNIPRGELVRFESKSKQFQPFLGGVSADLVSFSKNGQIVAYVSYPDNILWKVNKDGSARVQLTDPPLSPEWISLSPDGTQVLFMATKGSRSEAWIVSVQGGGPRRLLPEDGGEQTDPNWSPDGSKIVFATNRQDKPDRHSSIRVLDVATHQVTNVPGSDGLFSPHWSPDGQSIAASTLDLSNLNIFDRKVQHWSAVYKGLFAYANWSADSRFLYIFRYADDPAILRIPVKGGEAKLVVSLKDFKDTGTLGIWLGLDPTDAPLLLRDVGSSDVYALTLENK